MFKNIVLFISVTLSFSIIFYSYRIIDDLKYQYQEHITIIDKKNKDLLELSYNETLDLGKTFIVSDYINIDQYSHLLSERKKSISICVRIPGSYCSTCIDNYLDLFSEIIDSIGYGKAIVLVNYDEDVKIQYLKIRHNKLKDIIYNVKSIPLDIEKEKKPYLFLIDKNGVIYNIHLTNKAYPARFKNYTTNLKKVSERLFN